MPEPSPARRYKQSALTTGDLWTNIWQMSWPMVLIMIFSFLVGLADVYVAGFIGSGVQAAVGFIGQIYFLVIIMANAISIGTLAMIARHTGGGRSERAAEIARQSLLLGAVVAAALTVVTFLFRRQIIAAAGFPADIRDMAERFLKVFALSLGPNYLVIISNAVFRALGEVKKPLLTMFVVSVVNIAGDFALVFGIFPFPKLGYMGIAFSTAFSLSGGMLVNLALFGLSRRFTLFAGRWSLSLETIRRIILIAWPAAMLQIAWNAGTFVLYNILGRLGGSSITALASITNGLRIEAIIYLPAFALNMAASVLVGQNLGAGDPDRAERIGWKTAFAGVGLCTSMALAIFIWADPVAALVTRNPAVIGETGRYLRYNMVSEPFMALSAILGGGLQGAGDTKGTMWVIVVAMWVIRLPMATVLALSFDYGAQGVWLAMAVSMCCQGLMMTRRFQRGGWKKMAVDEA